MNRILRSTPAFDRDLRGWLKSRPQTVEDVQATLDQLAADSSHPSLRTYKLRGSLAGCWACSGGYDLRIVFEYVQHEGSDAILLLALDTHDQVY